jgi:serine/threonine protein kinase
MSVIPIDLSDIALESDLLPGDSPASIRIRARPSARGGELLRLHPEEIGTYARVFLGRVREARGWRSVAIKLQRDEVASDFAYDHQIVSAKFDEELANHLELQRSPPTHNGRPSGPLHTVRLLARPAHHRDVGLATLPPSEILPPCLLCLRGRHALRLLGRDAKPLQQGPPSGSQRYLELSGDDSFGRRYYSDHLDDVVRTTVGRDQSACASCELRGGHDPDSCLVHLRYINLFENRILFYQPLDLSLHDALRWWRGERRILAPRPRRAMLSIEARLRRSRSGGRHEPRDEAALSSLLDLRLRVNLFRQTLLGVESLHARGIPHLDINPENICLKVRKGRVEAQLIDLGMAANPGLTAKEQHEKRLWPRRADFAAEECQRSAIYSNRHLFVRVAPGRLASPIPACRGDQLIEEGPAPTRTTRLLEVVSVARRDVCIPGFGTFPYLCDVDGAPEAEAGPIALVLKLIPQRGLAADIFSLGMVLVSLLLHETSGDELRLELVKIEESLFSHWECAGADPRPIPGRVLVRRVLSHPDEHTRWFRERVEALRIYGEATPMAEELLGIALRALLRTTHHFPYLTDRGGDARLALRQLAVDVRAVGRALEEEVLAIRYREALNRRRGALRQFAAYHQIEIIPALPGPISDACDGIETDQSPVQDAVRMVAADPGRADVEIRSLVAPTLSKERITELIHHLDPMLDSRGPERLACTRSLWCFLEWLHRPDFDGERLRQLLESWELARSEGDGVPIGPWREHERELAGRLAGDLEAVQRVQWALATYDRRITHETNKFWRRALTWYRITITVEELRQLEQGWDSIPRLDAARDDSDRHAQQLRGRFEVELERWRQLGGEWSRAWMGELASEARAYWTIRLPESQDRWSRSRLTLVAGLRSFFELLRAAMASARERTGEMILFLPGATRDRLRAYRSLIPPVLTTAPVLGPAFEVEADSILRRLASRGFGQANQSEGGQQVPRGRRGDQ